MGEGDTEGLSDADLLGLLLGLLLADTDGLSEVDALGLIDGLTLGLTDADAAIILSPYSPWHLQEHFPALDFGV